MSAFVLDAAMDRLALWRRLDRQAGEQLAIARRPEGSRRRSGASWPRLSGSGSAAAPRTLRPGWLRSTNSNSGAVVERTARRAPRIESEILIGPEAGGMRPMLRPVFPVASVVTAWVLERSRTSRVLDRSRSVVVDVSMIRSRVVRSVGMLIGHTSRCQR
jgi:hypothetical protein